jgi:hypothetical protein
MNEEQLDNLESFDKKQLEIIATGIIERSNLDEFRDDALKFLGSIKTKLDTDEDFAAAKFDVKTCETVETRIANSWEDLINKIPAFANAKKVIFDLKAQITETRIALSKLVGSEEQRKKREITSGAKNRLNGLLINSPVKHGFVPNISGIDVAIKNKRLYSKMQEAVDEVVGEEELRLANMEADFSENTTAIETAESEWPGLFPDKLNLALSAKETVTALIQGRVADHRFKVAEKERKEKEAVDEKERLAQVVPEPVSIQPEPSFVAPPMPSFGASSAPKKETYVLRVVVLTDDINGLTYAIGRNPAVQEITVEP